MFRFGVDQSDRRRPSRGGAAGPMLARMILFPPLIWVTFAAIGAACVISFVYYLAVTMENERRVADLKAECGELRKRYARQMQQAVERADIIEVSPIEETDEPLLRAVA